MFSLEADQTTSAQTIIDLCACLTNAGGMRLDVAKVLIGQFLINWIGYLSVII